MARIYLLAAHIALAPHVNVIIANVVAVVFIALAISEIVRAERAGGRI